MPAPSDGPFLRASFGSPIVPSHFVTAFLFRNKRIPASKPSHLGTLLKFLRQQKLKAGSSNVKISGFQPGR